MRGYIKLKTDEAGKTIALTANVPANILVCNIVDVNNDPATFNYNAETGELTMMNRAVVEVTGVLFLFEATGESADLTINLELNGAVIQTLYTGINNQRNFAPFIKGFDAGDVLEFTVTSPDDITVETDTAEHSITIKRIN